MATIRINLTWYEEHTIEVNDAATVEDIDRLVDNYVADNYPDDDNPPDDYEWEAER